MLLEAGAAETDRELVLARESKEALKEEKRRLVAQVAQLSNLGTEFVLHRAQPQKLTFSLLLPLSGYSIEVHEALNSLSQAEPRTIKYESLCRWRS